jgi:hypothetical protein
MLLDSTSSEGDGIIPSHLLLFFEGPAPSWELRSLEDGVEVTWQTKIDRALEDGLLIIGSQILKNDTILSLLPPEERGASGDPLSGLDTERIEKLRDECKSIDSGVKAVLTVQENSALVNQLTVLQAYSMNVNLCLPQGLHRTITRI